jgi:segregation and condensation protein A
MKSNQYKIKTEKFEGPLDLLLDLIEKRKLLINDISLSQITDDFINYISTLGKIPARKVSDFLVVASTLILIKSKSLLPTLQVEEKEAQDIHELEIRLNILKIIKDSAIGIGEKFMQVIRFPKRQVKVLEPRFTPSEELNPHNMRIVALDIIKTLPQTEVKKEARVRKVISLEDMMNNVINRVKKNVKLEFSKIHSGDKKERVNVIISFLAVLELVKRGFISADQDKKFDEINLESSEVGTPSIGV